MSFESHMPEIETRNLSKKFGRLLAVNDLNFSIPKGTIFGFLGPNGAGKSTKRKPCRSHAPGPVYPTVSFLPAT